MMRLFTSGPKPAERERPFIRETFAPSTRSP